MVNLMGAVQIASAAEGIAMAERAGLDLRLVADAVASGQAASPQVVRNVRRFVSPEPGPVTFTPALRLKDIDYALRLARKLGIECPFGTVAQDLYRRLCGRGAGLENESRIIDVLRG
jgi:3-hydroxyisobutyrate dehydrogenase